MTEAAGLKQVETSNVSYTSIEITDCSSWLQYFNRHSKKIFFCVLAILNNLIPQWVPNWFSNWVYSWIFSSFNSKNPMVMELRKLCLYNRKTTPLVLLKWMMPLLLQQRGQRNLMHWWLSLGQPTRQKPQYHRKLWQGTGRSEQIQGSKTWVFAREYPLLACQENCYPCIPWTFWETFLNCLTPQHVDQLLFLQKNLTIFQKRPNFLHYFHSQRQFRAFFSISDCWFSFTYKLIYGCLSLLVVAFLIHTVFSV